jgi:hypothetical protein
MPVSFDLSRNLSFLAGEAREIAEEALAGRRKRRLAEGEASERKAEAALEAARRKLNDAIGAEAWAGVRQAMRDERIAVIQRMQPPGGLKLDRARVEAGRVRRLDAYLRDRGIDPKTPGDIGREAQAAVDDVLPAGGGRSTPGFHTASNLRTWKKLSQLNRWPLPWGDLPPLGPPDGGWEVQRPPWFGFNFAFFKQASANWTVDRDHILSPAAGLVGYEARMDIHVVDDFDYALAQVDTQVAFSFTPSQAGLIEVLIDAQSTSCLHHLETVDRWGWSDSRTSQINYLTLDVLHPNVFEPSLAEMSAFVKDTDDDTTSNVENLTRGQHYFAHLFSSGPVPAGQPVVVLIGTRSFDKSGANDVEIHSRSNFQWFLNSVQVRASP